MASTVDICNLALSHLGNRASVVAIDPVDGSVEADYCARFYPLARDEVLEMADWTFARTRAVLAPLSTNPSSAWAFAYALPADCMVPRRISSGVASMHEDDSPDFEVEGIVLLANQPNAVLIYTRVVDDPTRFPASFVTTVSYKLGAYLAGPILRGEVAATAAASLHKTAAMKAVESMTSDANRSWRSDQYVPSMVAARSGTGSTLDGINPVIYGESGYAIS